MYPQTFQELSCLFSYDIDIVAYTVEERLF